MPRDDAIDKDIVEYIRSERRNKTPEKEIRSALRSSGAADALIRRAFKEADELGDGSAKFHDIIAGVGFMLFLVMSVLGISQAGLSFSYLKGPLSYGMLVASGELMPDLRFLGASLLFLALSFACYGLIAHRHQVKSWWSALGFGAGLVVLGFGVQVSLTFGILLGLGTAASLIAFHYSVSKALEDGHKRSHFRLTMHAAHFSMLIISFVFALAVFDPLYGDEEYARSELNRVLESMSGLNLEQMASLGDTIVEQQKEAAYQIIGAVNTSLLDSMRNSQDLPPQYQQVLGPAIEEMMLEAREQAGRDVDQLAREMELVEKYSFIAQHVDQPVKNYAFIAGGIVFTIVEFLGKFVIIVGMLASSLFYKLALSLE